MVAIGFASLAVTFIISLLTATWYLSGRIAKGEGKLDVAKRRMDDKDTHCVNQDKTCGRTFTDHDRRLIRMENGGQR